MEYHIEQLQEAVEFFITPYADGEEEPQISAEQLGRLISITATLMDFVGGLLQERQ
jgi:hypothetical protein